MNNKLYFIGIISLSIFNIIMSYYYKDLAMVTIVCYTVGLLYCWITFDMGEK